MIFADTDGYFIVMNTQVKNLPRAQVELTIEISPEEYDPFLKKAAIAISENVKIAGFRPGKATYDVIKKQVGEEKIWEEALDAAIRKTLVQAMKENNIETVGSPKIEVLKLAAQNPIIYKATLNLLPRIENVSFDGISVRKKVVGLDEKKLQKQVHELQKMRGKEILVKRGAKMGDKVELDLTISIDRISIEGGNAKKLPIYLGENKFVPGFEDNLVGLKAGDSKEFPLTFPKNYHQKNVAGRLADCAVTISEVYEIQLPELNDAFAKDLQFKDFKDLEGHMKETLLLEARDAEEKRAEDEMVNALIEKNKFSDIPDILINSESKSMLSEMEQSVANQGISFDDYLSHLKKTKDQLLLEFTPSASKRIKGAILFREISKAHGITVAEEELGAALKNLEDQYHNNSEALNAIKKPEYKSYLHNILSSQKIMKFLKEKIVK